jgi:hypothetical protein
MVTPEAVGLIGIVWLKTNGTSGIDSPIAPDGDFAVGRSS